MKSKKNGEHEHWGSSLGVVLAVAGSAVGLGNFLRFPGQVVKYGGGTFMLPYLISLLIVAIPLATIEWALGRRAGRHGFHSPLGIFYSVGKNSRVFGLIGALSTLSIFVVGIYYIFIESWCLFYALQYLGGCLDAIGLGFSLAPGVENGVRFANADEYGSFFATLVGMGANGSALRSLLVVASVCAIANFTLVYLGVSKGIERFCKAAAPAIVICSLIVIVRVATLGNPTGEEGRGFLDGLGFMWNPSGLSGKNGSSASAALFDPETWLAATAQIFFTASICFGTVSTYASYIKPNDDVALTSLTATATNEICEVALGGLMAIPAAIMFLGPDAADRFASSFALGFTVLPNVFGLMPLGQFIGFAFFSLLSLAAVTSSISQIQPISAMCQEAFDWTRKRSIGVCILFYLLGATFVVWFSKDLLALDAFDFWIGNMTPFIVGITQTFLIAFIWGLPNLQKELDRGARIRLPRWLGSIAKYVSLPYLCVIFALWCAQNLGGRLKDVAHERTTQYSLGLFAVFALITITVALRAMKRWRERTPIEKTED